MGATSVYPNSDPLSSPPTVLLPLTMKMEHCQHSTTDTGRRTSRDGIISAVQSLKDLEAATEKEQPPKGIWWT